VIIIDASTTGEDAKSELHVATISFLAATAIMKLP
jgi:hypothetical protein